MKIIFQFGEFINESKNWSTILGPIATLISVAITCALGIILFNKGIKRDRNLANEQRERDYEYNRKIEEERRENEQGIKENERKKNIERFGQLFIELLNSCIETSRKQILEYTNYTDVFLKDLLGQHFPKEFTHKNFIRILTLDNQLIIDYFEFKGSTNKEFINALNQLDYLNLVFTTIPNDINEVNGKTVIQLSNLFLNIRNKILQTTVEYLYAQKRDKPDYANDQTYKDLNSMLINYQTGNDEKPNISRDYEMLIKVIKEKFIEEPYRYIPICFELVNLPCVLLFHYTP